MRFLVERGVRHSFYVITGLSMVLVITPDFSGVFHSAGAIFVWPVIGLLAWLVQQFEDTGRLASHLRNGHSGPRGARSRTSGAGMPGVLGQRSAGRA